ncbi:nuclear transport factor 2 family protein [Nostoc sp. CCY 9925]|uniref:nuclear transport factor 2 family protein n=1 Tax=Nostoc sp. CCY 9925 TaxID=3103865 RepID=UPI0039C6B493
MHKNSSNSFINITNSSNLVIELFRAIDSSDWQALKEILYASIIYERPGYATFYGLDRLLLFYQMERIIESGKHHIEKIVIEENNGACWGRFIGLNKNGCQIDELFAEVYSFEEGKIKTRRSYFFQPAI